MTAVDYSWEKYDLEAAAAERAGRIKKVMEEAIKNGGTDYHAKQDYGKAKLSLVPREIIWAVAAIREYGNNKYPDGGPDNWKDIEPERYRDAAFRHFLRYLDDPKGFDTESGLPHLWHLACNIAFLCEMQKEDFEDIPRVNMKGAGDND